MAHEAAMMQVAGMDSQIHLVRGQRVMLDSDLAAIYGVPTKQLNQQLRRNQKRFPADFAFQMSGEEFKAMRSQLVTASKRNSRFRPWAFTEHGAIMLATVLNSNRATEMSVFVVRAFVQMCEVLMGNRQLAAKLAELEKRVGGHDAVIADLITAIRKLLEAPAEDKPKREMGFHMRENSPRYRISRRN